VWLFFGFITSFIWVPLLIIASSFGIVFGTFLAFVFGVRSRPHPTNPFHSLSLPQTVEVATQVRRLEASHPRTPHC
jgi:hypothetical protein